MFLYTFPLGQLQSTAVFVAVEILLPWQQKHTFITVAFEGKEAKYLVQVFLEVITIHGVSCCYENLVTMVTKK